MVYITFPAKHPYSLAVRGAVADAFRACRVNVDEVTGGTDGEELVIGGKGILAACYPLYDDGEIDLSVEGEINVRFDRGSPHQLLFMTVLMQQLGGYVTPVAGGARLHDLSINTLLDNNLRPDVEAITEHRTAAHRARKFVR